MPIIVIGSLIVAIVRGVYGKIQLEHLKKTGKSLTLDDSTKIVLRSTVLPYLWPILLLGLSLVFGAGAINESNHVRIWIYGSASAFCFSGTIFLFYYQFISRVTIFEGTLICIDGFDRWEIKSEEVENFSISGFAIYVKKRTGKSNIKIPLYFESSELILAFIYRAASKNGIWVSL